MLPQDYFTNYPSRLIWIGSGVLFSLIVLFGAFLVLIFDQPSFPLPPRLMAAAPDPSVLSIAFNAADQHRLWELPSIENEFLVSLNLPRPGLEKNSNSAYLRLKSSHESRRISLPERIDLNFNDQGVLCFQNEPGPFWAELSGSLESDGVSIRLFVQKEGCDVETASFVHKADSPPIQKAEEFSPGSFLRILGESHWLGADLLSQLNGIGAMQRIEIGSIAMSLRQNDWIGWKGGQWIKIDHPHADPDLPIARIHSLSNQILEWDVWDSSSLYEAIDCRAGVISRSFKIGRMAQFSSHSFRSANQLRTRKTERYSSSE